VEKRNQSLSILAAVSLIVSLSVTPHPAFGQEESGFQINPGLNGAWFNPVTTGQGFLIEVFPDINQVFLAWFTYDTTLPDPAASAQVGNPGHRWLTAQGPIVGDTANLNVFLTSGGLFDDPTPVTNTPEGTITLTFQDCTAGTVDYDLSAADVSGSVPISRVANDNVALCRTMDGVQNDIANNASKRGNGPMASSQATPVAGATAAAADFQINPGHNGAWFNPVTTGQGYLLEVFPDINQVFLAWFTYDTTLPDPAATAQVGDPGHRWLTAQGPINGDTANLNVFLTSGGLFDDPTAVTNTPEGTITLTLPDCISGTVEYDLIAADVSGSVPISRVANDNVALCQSLSKGIVLEEDGKRSAVIGMPGGAIDVADTQGSILTLTLPEGVLTGTRDQVIDTTPLSRQTTLPTGQNIVAGLQWSSGPGALIGPAKLEILATEIERFAELAAFAFTPGGDGFYFVPLIVREEPGFALEAPFVSPGSVGVALLTADQMEQWTPPDDPPEAKYLQQAAIVVKRAAESDSIARTKVKGVNASELLSNDATDDSAVVEATTQEELIPVSKDWFDDVVQPILGSATGGCESAQNLVSTSFQWLEFVQLAGLEDNAELSGRLNSLEDAINSLNTESTEDIKEIDDACGEEPDPCKQLEIAQKGLVCTQILQLLGYETSEDQFVCNDAPTLLKLSPAIPEVCPGETINFSAVVSNMNGETLSVEQVDLRWASDSPDLLTVDSESGVAKTLEAGNVFVSAESEVCGQVLGGISYVRIGDVPDIKGGYSVVGSETVYGCEFDEDNGTFGGSGTATITFQDPTESMDTDIFAGSGSAPGLGESFEGTVQCNGAVTGTGTYTESEPCGENGEDTCITSGHSTFTGKLIGNTIKLDTTAQDTSGDICSAEGWANATRSN
jgi:hypothetical protein